LQIINNTEKMASLDDIMNITEEKAEIIIEAVNSKSNVLFTFDETLPIDGRIAFEKIYYLDGVNKYSQTKPLGKYILKNHQLTTLYYMIELEKMLFNVKTIDKNPKQEGAKLEVETTHYTNVGVLSDKVGAGKSYCIMALLNEAKSFHIKQLPFRSATWGCNEIKTDEFIRLDTNILLVPHGLVGQWKKYLESSGLKFYTIQKAKDIFGLANADCKFKGKQFSMIAKEDDEIVKGDDGDDGDEDCDEDCDEDLEAATTNVKAKDLSSTKPSTKPSTKLSIKPKTKQIALPNSDNDNYDTSSTSSIKKKAIITKRSKAEVEAIQANKEALEEQKESREPTNSELEKEKRMIRAKITNLKAGYNSKYNSPERNAAQKEYEALELQLNNINKQIKNNDLVVGAIKTTEIQKLHTAFENNSFDYLQDSLKSFLETFGHLDKRATERHDVILVSATFWNLFALYLNQDKYTVNRIIIDECNSVKGHRLVEVRRGFTWLITSSIQSMMTSNGYIWKQVLHPHGYNYRSKERTINSTGFIMTMIKELYERKHDNYKVYLINRPEYIEESMTLPEMKTILVISKDNANIQVLQGIVSHDVLQMLNAGDIDGVITRLDVAVGDESNVIEMVTRKYQDDLKVKEYELRVAIENPKYVPTNESQSIINKRTAIADLKRKIACIEERVKEVENCPICYDDFTNPTITPCCSNKFCLNCIAAALGSKSVCPMCKNELVMKNLLVISDRTKEEIMMSNGEGKSSKKKTSSDIDSNKETTYDTQLEELKTTAPSFGKYENMDKIFNLNRDNPVKKYLIFTEYESALNSKITSILDKYGLTYARIRGSSVSISSMVETYRQADDKINVLLINSKYFGSGLNLENTSDIIILHKMQADIEMQVIGRAQRYGRKTNLNVWKLYYQNEENY